MTRLAARRGVNSFRPCVLSGSPLGYTRPMSAKIPPLHALRAFEAAARLGSFARAAEELCITRSAVSHRIQLLEDLLGGLLGCQRLDLQIQFSLRLR